jgi:hypothetical protein
LLRPLNPGILTIKTTLATITKWSPDSKGIWIKLNKHW